MLRLDLKSYKVKKQEPMCNRPQLLSSGIYEKAVFRWFKMVVLVATTFIFIKNNWHKKLIETERSEF